MKKSTISLFIVVDNSGIPIVSINLQQEFEKHIDYVLFSGFIVAITQFLTEIISSENKITRFSQQDYEGLISVVNGERYYCLTGNNLFQYTTKFYQQIYSFVDVYFFNDEESRFIDLGKKETMLKSLFYSIFQSFSNIELIIPHKNDNTPFFWSPESEVVYDLIDGSSNIKEISFSANLKLQEVFAIVMILSWLGNISTTINIRDYIIFEKDESDIIDKINNTFVELRDLLDEEVYELFEVINGEKNVAELKQLFPSVSVEEKLNILIKHNLIHTIDEATSVSLLLRDYFNLFIQELSEELSYEEARIAIEHSIEESNNLFFLPINSQLSASFILRLVSALVDDGLTIKQAVIRLVSPVNNLIEHLNKTNLLPNFGKIMAIICEKLIQKHGFNIERMQLLNVFCKEDYLL